MMTWKITPSATNSSQSSLPHGFHTCQARKYFSQLHVQSHTSGWEWNLFTEEECNLCNVIEPAAALNWKQKAPEK